MCIRCLRKLWSGSIRRRLVLGIAFIHAAMMSVFVYDLVERQREFLLQQSRSDAQRLAQTMATSSVSWLLADDVSGLQEVVSAQLNYPHLRYAMVLSREGRVLGHSAPDKVGTYVADSISLSLLGAEPQLRDLVSSTRLTDVAAPIMVGDRLIGWARVGVGQDHINASLQRVVRDGQVFALVAILSGMVFAEVMARGLTRGLRQLIRVSSAVGGGHGGARARVEGEDELAVLAGTFNRMLDALARQAEEQKATELRLARSSAEFAAMFRSIPEAVFVTNLARRIVLMNPAALSLFGYAEEELIGRSIETIYARHDDFVEQGRLRYSINVPDGVLPLFEMEFRRKDGMPVHSRVMGAQIRDENGTVGGFVSLIQDVSRERQAEHQLLLAAQVFDNTSEGILMTDRHNRIVAVNRAFSEITGYGPEEVIGLCPASLHAERHGLEFYETLGDKLKTFGSWRGELWNRRKDGSVYPQWMAVSAVRGNDGAIVSYVGIFSDMTERKAADERVRFLAQHDGLTGLPNRMLLVERLQHAISRSRRESGDIAVLFIDYDRFKIVNDSLGHHAGDDLLVQVAERLRQCVREKDTVARLGGDEFVILLDDLEQDQGAATVAHKVLLRSHEPYHVADQDVTLTASIGISLYPRDGDCADTLIKNADAAMYHAKNQGRDNVQFYTSELNAQILDRLWMESKLRRALEAHELCLHYQPQVNTATGELVGVEALVRWQHPEHGLISPARFIPVAEETGLIVAIGDWVIREACRQNRQWQSRGMPKVPVAVNISALQYRADRFVDSVTGALRDSGLEARYLELELTESLLMQQVDSKLRLMEELRRQGVKLSIDDFGTGYSSLAYLKRFPIDKLKVDQSFVHDVLDDADGTAIVSAIIGMGRSLRLTTIAEGVETSAQYQRLRELGCDELQGYLISRPMPAEICEEWLRSAALQRSWHPG